MYLRPKNFTFGGPPAAGERDSGPSCVTGLYNVKYTPFDPVNIMLIPVVGTCLVQYIY